MSSPEVLEALTFKPYTGGADEGLRKFIREYPRLPYGLEHFDLFVNGLSSGPTCVLDIHQAGKRIAVAVLLDREDPERGILEVGILGYRWDLPAVKFLDAVLPRAEALAKLSGLKSVGIVSSLGLKVAPADLTQRGFQAQTTQVSYETSTLDTLAATPIPEGSKWLDVTSDQAIEVHEWLSTIMENAPGSRLPPLEQFKKMISQFPLKPRLLTKEGTKQGFAWSLPDINGIGTIILLARATDLKSQDYGKVCLKEALERLRISKSRKAVAETLETNIGACKLFEASGFRTTRKLTTLTRVIGAPAVPPPTPTAAEANQK